MTAVTPVSPLTILPIKLIIKECFESFMKPPQYQRIDHRKIVVWV